MASLDLKSLVSRLDDHCRRALEAAAGLTLSRSNYNVEVEHWLLKLMDGAETDIPLLLRHFEIEQGDFEAGLIRMLDSLRTGNARAPSLSPDLVTLMEQSWLLASIEHRADAIRSGHLLWALLAEPSLARRARETSVLLDRIQPDALKRDFFSVLAASSEAPAEIAATRAAIETPTEDQAAAATAADAATLRETLAKSAAALHDLQGEHPLIFPVVDGQAIAAIVESWTGIPAGRMRSDEIRTILNLEEALARRIIGQRHALEAVSQAMRTSRAGLTDPRKPIGVFLMVGTSGVGKTETALALAELLYGGDQNVTTINMTEFKEEHKVSLLMGSPPGYVGYGEGGILTEAVRRRPYSVVLLDEMEKAHPGVQDVFFQVFDKGAMKDGEGRDIDFKNTVIIMTSNAGTDLITRLFADPAAAPDAALLAELLQPELMQYFKPAFLGRVTLVPYFPLSPDDISKIVVLQLRRIARRLTETYGATFTYSPKIVDIITARCTESASGARNIEKILSRTVLPELSAEILARLGRSEEVASVMLDVDDAGGFVYRVT